MSEEKIAVMPVRMARVCMTPGDSRAVVLQVYSDGDPLNFVFTPESFAQFAAQMMFDADMIKHFREGTWEGTFDA